MTTKKQLFVIPRAAGPEPNVIASYAPMMPERGAIRDKSGNGYDLTRTGTPLTGQGSGIYVNDAVGSYYSAGTFIPVGASDFSYTLEHQMDVAPSGARYALNRSHYMFYCNAGAAPQISFDGGVTLSAAPFSAVGRGPYRLDGLYDGINQYNVMNGVVVDSDAVAPTWAGANPLLIGTHGTFRFAKVYNVRRTVAEARASYVREFAKQVLWQWTPHREFAGIATGTTGGDDDWYSPVGGSGLSIVWRTDLSEPAGGHLALTADAGSMARIEFPFRRPLFGSWLISYEVRNPAFAADTPIVGFTPMRGVDPTVLGSGSYWAQMYNNGGGWWRTSLYYANGAQIDGADVLAASVVAGTRMKALITRDVNGDWQVYTYCSTTKSWGWTVAVGNDVNALSEGNIVIIPRSSYIERVTYLQSELTPHELEVV